jgi:hypothetical protein
VAVGAAVGLGVAVGAAVGVAVGTEVGAAVGAAVGIAVGTEVGAAVGAAVGVAVGTEVGVGGGSTVAVGAGLLAGAGVGLPALPVQPMSVRTTARTMPRLQVIPAPRTGVPVMAAQPPQVFGGPRPLMNHGTQRRAPCPLSKRLFGRAARQ